jgi:predicted nucleic acid-binding protein
VTARYLVDKSAYARYHLAPVRAVLEPLIANGELAICGIILLEVLFSARSATDLVSTRWELQLSLWNVPMQQTDFDRAADIMAALAGRGLHRVAKIPDLLIAAVAERAGLTLLHYDEDFERIAAVTGQASEWVVQRGSL